MRVKTLWRALSHERFGPFEGRSLVVVNLNEGVNGLAKFPRGGETAAAQCRAAQDPEPTLYLIEPGTVGRREVKVDLWVHLQPPVLLRLVRIKVVENDVNLFTGVLGNNLVHEVEKLTSATAGVVRGGYLPGCYI